MERLLVVKRFLIRQRYPLMCDMRADVVYAIPVLLRNNEHRVLKAALNSRLLHPTQLMPVSNNSLLQEAVSLRASDECIRVLVEYGAKVEFNMEHPRGSALHMAVAQRDTERVALLAELEPDALTLQDRQERIPLRVAVQLCCPEVCCALLLHHACKKSFALVYGPLIMAEMIESRAYRSDEAITMFVMFLAHGMDVDARPRPEIRSVFQLVYAAQWTEALKYIATLDKALDAKILDEMQE
jgi:hypothetical protein